MISVDVLLLSLLVASLPASVLSTAHTGAHPHWYRQLNPRDYVTPAQTNPAYDYVVAGGGLAGLIVASRLSEDSSKTVLVLEAGPSGDAFRSNIDVPGDTYYTSMLSQPGFNWGYNTVNQPKAGNRPMTQPRGRTLGGSAAINGMYIVHPPKTQPNAWRDLIADSQATAPSDADVWGWDSIYASLKEIETFHPPTQAALDTAKMEFKADSLGTNGALQVTYPGYMVPITGTWLPTLQAVGIPSNPDAFSGDNVGGFFALSAINPSNWTRSYSKTGWIDALPPRSNLHVVSGATVEQVIFSSPANNNGDKQATGVKFGTGKGGDGEHFEVKVNAEVILSGGAMGSPHMLMVSGVGPRDVLEGAGVNVEVELPGVGQHLMDHLASGVYFKANTETQGDIRASGSDLSKTPEFNSFVNSGVAYVNGSLLFESQSNLDDFRKGILDALPDNLKSDSGMVPSQYAEVREGYKAIYEKTVNDLYKGDGLVEMLLSVNAPGQVAVQAALQLPMSQGRITIGSNSIYDPLLIDPQYFSHEADLVLLRQGVKLARKIASTPPLSASLGEELTPGPDVQTDAQIEDWIRNTTGTEFHPCGTAAMLPREKGGVVDARLKVYGVSNLRVVDASVFPVSFSAHMMTPVYALAERAVEIITDKRKPNSGTPQSGGSSSSGSGSSSGSSSGKPASGAQAVVVSTAKVWMGVVVAGLVASLV